MHTQIHHCGSVVVVLVCIVPYLPNFSSVPVQDKLKLTDDKEEKEEVTLQKKHKIIIEEENEEM